MATYIPKLYNKLINLNPQTGMKLYLGMQNLHNGEFKLAPLMLQLCHKSNRKFYYYKHNVSIL